ncbi:MAG: GNAT family N-acetyltransferase [Campylobacteraceae bacterium]|jgi:phosphinothricin acetyltransferase|nr:GNAT family N-acetyltransferase [Campylobacteraceae bacterium]
MDIKIRKMSLDDIQKVLDIYRHGIDIKATFETKLPNIEEWDEKHLKVCRIVALIDKNIVGWAALMSVSNREVYKGVAEVSCYISPNHTRKGIGTLLMNKLISMSEQEGFWTLEVKIVEDNIPSILLCEKCGFRLVGYKERLGYDRDGVWKNIVIMERRSKLI